MPPPVTLPAVLARSPTSPLLCSYDLKNTLCLDTVQSLGDKYVGLIHLQMVIDYVSTQNTD